MYACSYDKMGNMRLVWHTIDHSPCFVHPKAYWTMFT